MRRAADPEIAVGRAASRSALAGASGPLGGEGRAWAEVRCPEVGCHHARDPGVDDGTEEGRLVAEQVVDVALGVAGGNGAEPGEVAVGPADAAERRNGGP